MNTRFLSPYAWLALAVATFISPSLRAQTFKTLVDFTDNDGSTPYRGPMIQAPNGNYYGATEFGGLRLEHGTVFEVTSAGNLTVLYKFCSLSKCADGANPMSGPILGTDGNLYGTTASGGSANHGTIYKMTLAGELTTLYSFCKTTCSDGSAPLNLMLASNGNFYGITGNSATGDDGTIFELTKSGTFKTLHTFCSQPNCADGTDLQYNQMMQATNGDLYGTTFEGGTNGGGVIYRITPAGQFKVLYNFCNNVDCTDGWSPIGGLVQGSDGNFYGTSYYGGANGDGTVFEFTSKGELVTLHSFDLTDGGFPIAAPIQANDGNFYGLVYAYGVGSGGTIYKISSEAKFTTLYNFCGGSSCTGTAPYGMLLQATDGSFYGMTSSGGTSNNGTIFHLSAGLKPLVHTVPTTGRVGSRVTILGNKLTGSTSVKFNGTSAEFTVVSSTEITATVPTGATSGTVQVVTPTRTLNSNPAFQVTP